MRIRIRGPYRGHPRIYFLDGGSVHVAVGLNCRVLLVRVLVIRALCILGSVLGP